MPFSPRPGTKCRVCLFERVHEVNTHLLRGDSVMAVARAFGLPTHTLYRHRQGHLPAALRAAETRKVRKGETSLLDEIMGLQNHALSILNANRDTGNHASALAAIREAARVLDLRGRVTGEIPTGATVVVMNQLGVTLDQAKRAVEIVQDAHALPQRAVVERAAAVLRAWNQANPADAFEVHPASVPGRLG